MALNYLLTETVLPQTVSIQKWDQEKMLIVHVVCAHMACSVFFFQSYSISVGNMYR